jgi:hypothetical protein
MKRSLFAVLALAVVALPAFAQVQYGTVSGTVVDTQQEPVPGVTVTLSGPAMQGTRSTQTDAEGRYRLLPVPPGSGYTLIFTLDGFNTLEKTGLNVSLGKDTAVNAEMAASTFAETISVTADQVVVDTTASTVVTTVDSDLLDTLPNDRFYPDMLALAPGVRPGNNPFANGASNDSNLYLIDGIDTTDPIYLTWGTQINWDIVDEAEVQTGGFTAEYGRSTGAVMNMITKSGGNDLSLLARFTLDEKDWSASPGIEEETGAQKAGADTWDEPRPSIAIGGPILRDRLWFFVSYENRDLTRDYAYYPSAEDALANTLTTGEFYYKGHFFSGKLTWQVNPSHSIMGFYNEDPIDFYPLYAGSRGDRYYSPDAERSQFQGSEDIALHWNGLFSDRWFIEAKYQDHNQKLDIPEAGVPWEEGKPYIYDTLSGYNYSSAPYDFYSDRYRDGILLTASYFLDTASSSHQFKAGVDWADMSPKAFWYWNVNGWYRMRGTEPIRKELWPNQTGPRPFYQDYMGLFIQDKWQLGKLTLNLGLRAEATEIFNNVKNSLIKFGFSDQIAPRLGFSYDLNGDVVRGSIGRFYYMPSNYIAQYFAEIPDRHLRYSWNGTCDPNAGPVWEQPDNCWSFVYDIPVAFGSTTIDPSLDPNYMDEVTLGYEKRLSDLLAGSISFIWREQDQGIDFYDPEGSGYYYITNIPNGARDYPEVGEELASKKFWEYQALQLSLRKRFGKDGFQFIANYTYVIKSDAWDNVDTNKWAFVFWAPETMDPKRYGTSESPHYLKLNGSYTMPWRMVLGLSAYWNSGNVYAPVSWMWPDGSWTWYTTYFVGDRGSQEVGDNWEADLYIEQPFKIGPLDLSIYANVFNAFNNQQPTARLNNVDYDTYGEPSAWQSPRRVQLGIKIEY